MKTLSQQDRSQIAAEYVLGTLRGAARQRFERMIQEDPLLWQEVAFWERRLGALGEALPEMAPPARVWAAIEAEIGNDRAVSAVAKPTGLLQRLGFWRGFSLLASGLAAALLVVLLLPREPDFAPVQVATLSSEQSDAAWLVRVGADGRGDITPIGTPMPPPGRAFELWLLRGNDNPPLSLGVAGATGRQAVAVPATARDGIGFAISIEPPGGSPTGAPTGPVVFVGNLVGTQRN